MPPPYGTSYLYFKESAKPALRRQFPRWTDKQITNTINLLWHDQIIPRAAFDNARDNQDANLPPFPVNLVPNRPNTKAEVDRAKKRVQARRANAGGALAQAAPPQATAAAALTLHVPPAPPAPPPVALPIAPPVVPAASPVPNLPYPYSYWPPPPWPKHPAYPGGDVDSLQYEDNIDAREDEQTRWLATRPLVPGWAPGNACWRGVEWLGEGSFGRAGRWTQYDAHDNAIDHVVIKDDYSQTRNKWRDPMAWLDRVPFEVRIHQLVETCRGDNTGPARNLIRFRAYRLWMAERRVRIYLDYYNMGSLWGCVFVPQEEEGRQLIAPVRGIWEEFVWYLLSALVDAVDVLHRGVAGTRGNWRAITHCDIQPTNVFLHKENPNDQRRWPTLVLADFGMAVVPESSPHAGGPRNNPQEYKYVTGRQGRYPPELHSGWPHDTPINDKSDVYQIGTLIWQFVSEEWSEKGPLYVRSNGRLARLFNLGGRDHTAELFMQPRFSDELTTLVRSCLHLDQARRLTIAELKREVDRHLAAHPTNQNLGLPF
ncbi:kinase-like protein [Amniculicola lignicola CBS 123094]|uniref:non-specific serine/threonine protein kinase n=1 Tax=Amniculicola lignicola CBS 123094 TaxID=1392246 RepID=A0A6A5WZR4_9PLEO|nr:kinase-like protein [Amniculicola lignicola CBS 123094]